MICSDNTAVFAHSGQDDVNIGYSWRVINLFFSFNNECRFLNCILSSQTKVSWCFVARVLPERETQSEVDYSRGESGVFVLTG